MYLEILKTLFIITGIFLVVLLSLRKYISAKINDNLKVSAFISVIAGFLLLYVILAVLLAIIVPNIILKIFMVFFAASPFIIGRLATYEKIKIYGFIQIFVAAAGVLCVYLF